MENRIARASLVLVLIVGATAQTKTPAPAKAHVDATPSGWTLVWSDEFNGAANTGPDTTKWDFDLGGGGWGNGEAEVYTNSPNNVFQDGNGNLVIRVIKDELGGYTSARLQTGSPGASTSTADNKWQYGRIEARIKLPPGGKGIWPAFWMLGEDISTAIWPRCGEVDIMENFGAFQNNTGLNNGTIHGPGNNSLKPPDYPPFGVGTTSTLPFGESVSDDFHIYAVEWSQDSIEFFFDGASYQTLTPASLPAGSIWVFNAPFYVLLNFAIGGPGTFLGTPDSTVTFPQDMLVDYVRVYQTTSVSATTPVITPGRIVNSASYLGAISPGSQVALYGSNLADAEHLVPTPGPGQTFPFTVSGVSVSVNGVPAALSYVSSTQINFQLPWETPAGPNGVEVPVKVTWNSTDSAIEYVTVSSVSSPSFFLSEFVNGVAWVTGNPPDGCPTPTSECSVKAGSTYQLWANGLGPKASPLQDGVPAPGAALQMPGGPTDCTLTIGGQPATVVYCGAAPTEIIDQVNFTYPSGVTSATGFVGAALTVNGVTGHFRVPAPTS